MRHYRKLSTLVLVTTAMLMLAGCDSYSSLRPLYTDDDLVFNAELLGTWGTKDSTETIEFARAEEASHGKNAYKVTIRDSNSETEENIAHLVKLGDRIFLDVLPGEPQTDSTDNLLAVHTFFLISHIGSTMEIAGLRIKWLTDFVAQYPDAIRFEKVGERLVLTATTKELQQFLMSHQNDGEAFGPFEELQRKPIM